MKISSMKISSRISRNEVFKKINSTISMSTQLILNFVFVSIIFSSITININATSVIDFVNFYFNFILIALLLIPIF